MKEKLKYLLIIFALVLFITSCKDKKEDETDNPGELTDNEYTNQWIHERLTRLYYWNDKLPAKPNYTQDPKKFFYNILFDYGKVAGDRFSWIEEDKSKSTKNLFTNDNVGFDCIPATYFPSKSAGTRSKIGYFVISVNPQSDAAIKGLKRGNVIYEVNGSEITEDNYETLLSSASLSLSVYDSTGKQVTLQKINPTYTGGSPLFLSKVIKGTQIGYIKYDAFERGNDDDGTNYDYDVELIAAITNLKGIKDLVLDLRNNPGGYATSALNLASALVPNRDTEAVFAKYKYNSHFQDSIVKKWGSEALNDYFVDHVYNYSTNKELAEIPKLNLSRIFIIANEYSASASEMVINGLKPYFAKGQLYQIGTTTVGKDQASITVKADSKRIKWQLQPIIAKLSNANNVGNYINGLDPSIAMNEWEEGYTYAEATSGDLLPLLSQWIGGFKDFGDPEEPLLAEAIAIIKPELRKKTAKSHILRGANLIAGQKVKVKRSNYRTIIDENRFERSK